MCKYIYWHWCACVLFVVLVSLVVVIVAKLLQENRQMRKTVRIMLPCVCVVCMCARKRKCVSSEPGLELYVLLYLSLIRTHVSMSSPAPKVSIPIITTTTTGTLCHAALTHIYVMRMCEWVRILHMRMPPPPDSASLSLPPSLTLSVAGCLLCTACTCIYVCVFVCVRDKNFSCCILAFKFLPLLLPSPYLSLPVPVPNFLCVTRPHFSKANVVRVRMCCVCDLSSQNGDELVWIFLVFLPVVKLKLWFSFFVVFVFFCFVFGLLSFAQRCFCYCCGWELEP